jgi:hypothetical protein
VSRFSPQHQETARARISGQLEPSNVQYHRFTCAGHHCHIMYGDHRRILNVGKDSPYVFSLLKVFASSALTECWACHIKPLVVLHRGCCGYAGTRCSPRSAGSPYYYYSSASPPKPAPRRARRPPGQRHLRPIARPGPRPGRRRHRLRQHHHRAQSRRRPRRQYQPRARRCQCQPRPRRRHPRRLPGPRLRHPRRRPRSAAIRSPMGEIATSRVNSAGSPTTG